MAVRRVAPALGLGIANPGLKSISRNLSALFSQRTLFRLPQRGLAAEETVVALSVRADVLDPR